LLYETISAIVPKGILVPEGIPNERLATDLESVAHECEAYGKKGTVILLDPRKIIETHGDEFTRAVVADMRNPFFEANAPKGEMNLYADKLNRDLFDAFRHEIKIGMMQNPEGFRDYKEGPYRGTDHFIWPVKEPLAHSILLNLALLGCNDTKAVPFTDSKPSHVAMLSKLAGVDRQYEAQVAAKDLCTLALPTLKTSDVRSILDFRDKHKDALDDFWRTLAKAQDEVSQYFSPRQDLFSAISSKWKEVQTSLKDAKTEFRWTMTASALGLVLGIAGRDVRAVGASIAATAVGGIRYFGASRESGLGGFSYLLLAENELSARPPVP
jgi:hypothetical protein